MSASLVSRQFIFLVSGFTSTFTSLGTRTTLLVHMASDLDDKVSKLEGSAELIMSESDSGCCLEWLQRVVVCVLVFPEFSMMLSVFSNSCATSIAALSVTTLVWRMCRAVSLGTPETYHSIFIVSVRGSFSLLMSIWKSWVYFRTVSFRQRRTLLKLCSTLDSPPFSQNLVTNLSLSWTWLL
jgi:hypothetical protein